MVSLTSSASLRCGPFSRPGWTSASLSFPVGGTEYSCAVSAKAAGPAAMASPAAAMPTIRPAPLRAVAAITIAVLAATRTKLISQMPPTAASARTTGCCHWLAP